MGSGDWEVFRSRLVIQNMLRLKGYVVDEVFQNADWFTIDVKRG